MLSREYTKRISFYEVTISDDGYGGTIPNETLLFTSWCKITTNGLGRKATDLGLTEFKEPLLFECRFRSDFSYQGKTLFVVYGGKRYVIQAVRDIDMRRREVEVFATKSDAPWAEPETDNLFVGGYLNDDGILNDSQVYDLT